MAQKKKRKSPPKLVKKTAERLKAKGFKKEDAFAIATSTHQKSGSLKKGSHELTKIGKAREKMTSAERKKARKKGTVRQTTKIRKKAKRRKKK